MSMTTIRNRIRFLLGDVAITSSDIFTYGSSDVFTLSEPNISSVDYIERNNTNLDSSGNWSYASTHQRVTLLSASTAGDTIEIFYTYFPNYSNTELDNYIQGALIHLSINNYYNYTYDSTAVAIFPEPLQHEENLIAMITAILIRPDNKSYRLPDITVTVPDDLPVDQKINKLIGIFKHDSHGEFFLA